MSEMLKKFVSAFNLVIPFLEPYPPWAKALISVWILLTALIVICLLFCRSPKEEITNELDNGSQSTRATAIRSAAAELGQIANNFEIWAEKERNKFRRGFSPSDSEKWMGDWLADSYIATLFNYPVARQTNGLFPSESKKEFRLIIDTFRLYMPSIADSLSETYNNFLRGIKFHVQRYELEKQQEDPLLLFWCTNFLDTEVTPTVRRLRHIAEMAKENLATSQPTDEQKQ